MKNLFKNRKKGFTLVELIVVIVIIAVLIAALTPAILGVIGRANISANDAETRTILVQLQVFAITPVGGTRPVAELYVEARRLAVESGFTFPVATQSTHLEIGDEGIPTGLRLTGGRGDADGFAGSIART